MAARAGSGKEPGQALAGDGGTPDAVFTAASVLLSFDPYYAASGRCG
jgi:hypothetical protein